MRMRSSSPFPGQSTQIITSVSTPFAIFYFIFIFILIYLFIYLVIKHPMDLGTMLKHVKARKYKSKHEFSVDLNLIWKNCFKYNSGPVSFFAKQLFRTNMRLIHPSPLSFSGSSTSRMRHSLAAQSRASLGPCIRPSRPHHYHWAPDSLRSSIHHLLSRFSSQVRQGQRYDQRYHF